MLKNGINDIVLVDIWFSYKKYPPGGLVAALQGDYYVYHEKTC